MKRWARLSAVVVGLALLAWTSRWWAPPLFEFASDNTGLIQGLSNLVQLILWLAAAVVFLLGWRKRTARPERAEAPERPPGPTVISQKAELEGNGAIAQGAGATAVGKGGIVVRHDGPGDVNITVDSERSSRKSSSKPPSQDLRLATKEYLAHLVDRYRYLDFRGMGVMDKLPLGLPLIDMYVPLKARIELPEGDTWTRDLKLAGRRMSEEEIEAVGKRLGKPEPLLDLLKSRDGLIILGDPGAGKTTFLKYLTLHLALGTGEAVGLETRVPFLLPISAYANALAEKDVPLSDFIAEYYEGRGINLPVGRILEEALDRGGALLLLDGLDEVRDHGRRRSVVDQVVDFYTVRRKRGNKFILTSRIIGYREVRPVVEGLAECTLVDFEEEDIKLFIEKWTSAVEKAARGKTRVAAEEAEQERKGLLAAVERNPGVRRLASNPLLLTILALMKRQGITLPERRVELYQKCVETLLKHWNLARGLGRTAARDLDVVETMKVLAPLALWMHETSPGVGLVKREDLRRKLVEIFENRGIPDPEATAGRFLEDVRDYAGLVLERGPKEYGFIHLTFQEYLAAVSIALRGQQGIDRIVEILSDRVGVDAWHEVSLLTIGYLGIVQQRDEDSAAVLASLIARAPKEPGLAVVFAGEAVLDTWPGGVTLRCREAVIEALASTMRDDRRVAPKERASAGRVLAKLGDPRPEVLDPLRMEFCDVPAGPFLMGSQEDPNAFDDEKPGHEFNILYNYKISRFPVTNAHFRAFVKAGGYRKEKYWEKDESGYRFSLEGPFHPWEPFNLPNHPVVTITWYEALAFSRWLGEKLIEAGKLPENWEVRLPSEPEWEKAARGTDGRIYPWGRGADPNLADYEETGVGSTSAVGCFPGGASPYGVEEMSGNAWEWTRSLWGEEAEKPAFGYRYDPEDGRENLSAHDRVLRVLRGGGFNGDDRNVRCAVRYGYYPYIWGGRVGFRVVASTFSSDR